MGLMAKMSAHLYGPKGHALLKICISFLEAEAVLEAVETMSIMVRRYKAGPGAEVQALMLGLAGIPAIILGERAAQGITEVLGHRVNILPGQEGIPAGLAGLLAVLADRQMDQLVVFLGIT
jgi:hypothetical protein